MGYGKFYKKIKLKSPKRLLATFFFLLFCAIVLVLSLRGIFGNPTPELINNAMWKDEGPFELSPERGRFALTLSIAEYNSFYYTLPIARFATPDLGYKNGNYVSLFAPGVSYIVLPGYLLGKIFGLGQVGVFAVIAIFAILNAFLIRKIATMLGANNVASSIGALAFLFATPSFAYGVSLYQHHISTFLVLSCLYLLLRFKSVWALFLIWFIAAASVPIDYPNLIFMVPIAIFALGRILYVSRDEVKYIIRFRLPAIFTSVTAILPILFFMWFNLQSYGTPFQLSGTVGAVQAIDEQGYPTSSRAAGVEQNKPSTTIKLEKQNRSALAYFNTRNLLNGFYIHSISPDRGVVMYAPVILLGIFGFSYLFRRNSSVFSLLLGIVGGNVLLYSMWGDPWGGWAFGSRYLIPSYAVMAIFLGLFITHIRRKSILLGIFFIIFSYSVAVNTLGALTSSRNPPQAEILSLEKETGMVQKYTFERNFEFLQSNRSKSYMFQTYFYYKISAFSYYTYIASMIIFVVGCLLIYYRLLPSRKGENNG